MIRVLADLATLKLRPSRAPSLSLILSMTAVCVLIAIPLDRGIQAQHDRSGQWFRYAFAGALKKDTVIDIGQDKAGFIWIMGSARLYYLDGNQFRRHALPLGPDEELTRFFSLRDGRLGILTSQRAISLADHTPVEVPKRLTERSDRSRIPVPDFAGQAIDYLSTHQETYVLLQDRKLYRYRDSLECIVYPDRNQISFADDAGISKHSFLFEDKDRNIWITGSRAVLLYKNSPPLFTYQSLGPGAGRITQVYEDTEHSRIYILSSSKGIFVLDSTLQLVRNIPADVDGTLIRGFKWDILGDSIYIYGLNGLHIYNTKTNQVTTPLNPEAVNGTAYPALRLNHMVLSPDSTLFYVASKDNIFFKYFLDDGAVNTYQVLDIPYEKDTYTNLIYEIDLFSNLDALLLCTDGLYLMDEKTHTIRAFEKERQGFEIPDHIDLSDIALIRDSLLIMSSFTDGLFVYDLVHDTVFKPNMAIRQRLDISDLFLDHDQNVWGPSKAGIVYYTYKTNTAVLFDSRDGLPADNFHYRYMNADHGKKKMHLGLVNSYLSFYPENLGAKSPAQYYIREIEINGRKMPFTGPFFKASELTLPYSENNIKLHFASPNYGFVQNLHFKTRMEGLQNTWSISPDPDMMHYTALRPGDYRFAYMPAVQSGDRNYKYLDIQIQKPFWERTWVRIAAAVTLLAIILVFYLYRLRYLKREARLRLQFERQLAEVEMKALRAQMNPHFLFNSLNSVKSLIAQRENDKAVKYLTRFSQLIRQVLNNSRRKFVRLNDELEALDLYLELESMRFREKFNYAIRTDPDVNADFIEVPPMILQPYVENAIWHGLLHKMDGDRQLDIIVSRNGASVKIVVQDNGIGRQNAAKLHTRSGAKQESLGMQITDDRLKLLKDLYGKESRVTVEDLKDPPGTRVTLSLPIPE